MAWHPCLVRKQGMWIIDRSHRPLFVNEQSHGKNGEREIGNIPRVEVAFLAGETLSCKDKKNNFFTWLEYLLGQTRSTSPVNQKMNRQESEVLKKFVASAPASPWKYWPFAFPCLFAIVGFLIHLGILIWFKTKADISLLVQNGENITTFWDSRLTQSFVLTTSLLIVFNFALLAVLAALTLRQRQVIDRLISEREDKGH